MRKIFTFFIVAFAAANLLAQPSTMKFVGKSNVNVMTTNVESASDTILFAMNDIASGDITLPEMNGMGTIPSFTIKGATFAMGADRVVTFPEQEFSATAVVDGVEKQIEGTSLSGTYNMADNSLSVTVVFKYGSMPFAMTYSVNGYYVKAVTNSIEVVVGGVYPYVNESVTYNVRKYVENGVEMLDVEVPHYTLDNTVIGNLDVGSYVVRGLKYDEEKEGYYRDYKDDGLSFHFSAEQGGMKTMDGDYMFNPARDNNILVQYDGKNVACIVNKFQMGVMPFPIVSTFGKGTTGIDSVIADGIALPAGSNCYNLNGQRVSKTARGIVIINGRKYLKR